MASTNFIDGVTNVSASGLLGSYVAPSPVRVHQFWDDFDQFNNIASVSTGADPTGAAAWSLEQTFTAGTPTAVVGGDGGILTLTNGTSNGGNSFVRWKGYNLTTVVAQNWRWAADKSMWFAARFKVSDATKSSLIMGLQINDTTPLAVTDGLFFSKATDSTTLNFIAEKNSTTSTVAVGTMANDTYVAVGFHWAADIGKLKVYLNDAPVGSLTTTTNFPDDEDLLISFGVQNGEALAKSMAIDYVMVAKER